MKSRIIRLVARSAANGVEFVEIQFVNVVVHARLLLFREGNIPLDPRPQEYSNRFGRSVIAVTQQIMTLPDST